jgi:ABC-type uncharacterized transport system involved in gliding motility auxiliary subunit
MSLSRKAAAAIALLCAVALLVGINVIADKTLRAQRIDLTQQKLYTLSSGSKSTLAKIDEPLTFRFYFSKRLGDEIPTYALYATRVRELLQEYAALANGRIRLEELDPVPYSAVEDRAVAFGLQGVPIDQGGEQVYFGLAATNSTDDQQVIPFFQPERERFLEYDLTRIVHNLAFPKKPVVALVTSLPLEGDVMAAMQGRPMQPMAVIEQLRPLYDVKTLGGDIAQIDKDVDVLLLAHPQNLTPKTLYAIDQFVLRGGKALVFVDPNSEMQAARPSQFNPPGAPHDSDLPKLFAVWGVELVPKTIAGDRNRARRVNAGTAARVQAVDYPAWMNLKKDSLDQSDPITAELSALNLATPGILLQKLGAETRFEPLVQTSVAGGKIAVEKVQSPVPDVAGILRDFKREPAPLTLAARITGPAASAFPEGPPKDEKKEADAKQEETKEEAKAGPPADHVAKGDISVVVVADTDLLDDRFWIQAQDFFGQRVVVPVANNGDFVANAIEVLAGGTELVSLRSRGTSARPFVVVQEIQREAEQRYSAKEKELQDQLKDLEGKMKDIRVVKDAQGQGVVLTSEQEAALEQFRAEMVRTRQQLRDVQLALRQDIDRLKSWLQFANIALVPILVGFVAIVLGIVRMRRRARRYETA